MEELKNCLLDQKIRVEYIPKFDTIYNVPNSPAKDGMHAEAVHKLPLPFKNGQRIAFLTGEEIAFLGSKLGADLSFSIDPNKKSYWDTFTLPVLTVRNFELDLSDPVQYIQWKALGWWPKVAATPEEEKAKPREVRWRMINPEIQHSKRVIAGKSKKEAWRVYGQFEKSDKEILLYIYFLLKDKTYDYKQVTEDDLTGMFEPILDNDAATFLVQTEQPDLKVRSLIYSAWMAGILTKKSDGFWRIKDGQETKLFKDNEDGTLIDAANFILDPSKQTLKFEIEAAFKKYKE